jgi:osmotically-inducible protein OsmY
MQIEIMAAWRDESGIATERVGVSVEKGVVCLSGEIDNVHDKMALLRIAAAMEATVAIVDDLWLCCE